MKTFLNLMTVWLGLAAAWPVCAAVPFSDGFDDPGYYSPGTTFVTPIRGWSAGAADIFVTADASHSAPHSVWITGPSELTNAVAGAAGQVVWTDFRMRPVFGGPPSLTPHGTASLAGYFTTSHRFAIMPAGLPQECTQTVWGASVPLLPDGEFARITIYQDYARSNSAVFVNSALVAQDVPFYGSRTTYDQFLVRGGYVASTSRLDTVSFSNGPPTDLTADQNGDGLPDVSEFAQFGYAMRYFPVASNAVYTSIQSALNAVRPRDVIVVTAGTYAGNVLVNRAVGGLTGGVFSVGGTFTVGAGLSLTSRVGLTCGDLTLSNAASLTVFGDLTASNVNVSTAAWLTVNGGLKGSNVNVAGSLSLTAGSTITCTNLVLGTNAVVALTNVTITAVHLVVGSGGRLAVSNGTLSADGLVLTGSFVLDDRWGNSQALSTVPFSDGFEDYPGGTRLNTLGFRGWGTSSTNAQVQSQPWAMGANVAMAPGLAAVSNRVDGTGQTRVWTDFRIRPSLGAIPLNMPTNQSTCLFHFSTDGFVVVYNPTNGWDVCTSNAQHAAVTNRVSTGTWARLTLFVDFSNRQSAVFLDGELLREGIPFGAGASTFYRRFTVENKGVGGAYLDEVSVAAVRPPDLYRDIDGDGRNDFVEMAAYGTLNHRDPGAVFRFR